MAPQLVGSGCRGARVVATVSGMNTLTLPAPPVARPGRSLELAARGWLLAALAGQAVFAVYVAVFYGGALLQGQPERWTRVLVRGAWLPGDPFGNAVLAAHLLFTVIIVAGAMVQLAPSLRRAAPALHRWNGRLYLLAAVVLSAGGLYMLFTRGSVGGPWQHAAVATNALVILACAVQAGRHARARRVAEHRRWALRLFLAVSGVWFFRVMLMGWVVANQGPAGFDPRTFTGPALVALAWAQFLLPLAVLEVVLRVQAGGSVALRRATAALLVLLTLAMIGGILAATLIMWVPPLR